MHSSLYYFIERHDDLPAFQASYLVLAVLTAALLNLGFFGLLIAAHMVLDVMKYHKVHRFTWKTTLEGTIRESIIDLALLALGLVFAVYLHHAAGVIAVSGILRAEGTVARMVGTLLPKVEILTHFVRVFSHVRFHLEEVIPGLRKPWPPHQRFALITLALSIVLVAVAPSVLSIPPLSLFRILSEELIPRLT